MTKAWSAPVRNERAESAVVAIGCLRVSVLTHLPALLRELGQDPDELIAEAGIDPPLLTDPENTVAFRAAGHLLQRCATRTRCRHIGLILGHRSDAAALGLLGLLVQHSPDVGAALRNLTQRLHVHDRGAVPTLEQTGDHALLGYGIYERDVPGCDQIYAAAMALANRIMQGLCGAGWRATEVLLPFRRPADQEPYKRAFRSSLRFDANRCALVFPAEVLGQRVVGADPSVHQSVEKLVAVLESQGMRDISSRVRRALRASLISGRATEDAVARAFAVHRRTLNRRLLNEGTTFRRLLDETRFEVARQLLRDSNAAVDQIACGLGYSGASAFGRAFKRWTGRAPHAWRASGAD